MTLAIIIFVGICVISLAQFYVARNEKVEKINPSEKDW